MLSIMSGSSQDSASSERVTADMYASDQISSLTSEDERPPDLHKGRPIEFEVFDKLTFPPTCDEPEVVRYSGGQYLQAATPLRLIAQITSSEVVDYELLSDFFLTYRAFMTSQDLLQHLECRLRWALARKDETGRIVRVRTFVALRHWVLNYFLDDFLTSRAIRVQFCEKINSLYNALRQYPTTAPADLQILAELKRCWSKTCSLYWYDAMSDVTFSQHDSIIPGGSLGSHAMRLPSVRRRSYHKTDRRPECLRSPRERLMVETDSFIRYKGPPSRMQASGASMVQRPFAIVRRKPVPSRLPNDKPSAPAEAEHASDLPQLYHARPNRPSEPKAPTNGQTSCLTDIGPEEHRLTRPVRGQQRSVLAVLDPVSRANNHPLPFHWGNGIVQNGDLIKGRQLSPTNADNLFRVSKDIRPSAWKRSRSIGVCREQSIGDGEQYVPPGVRKLLGSVRRAIESTWNQASLSKDSLNHSSIEPHRSNSWTVHGSGGHSAVAPDWAQLGGDSRMRMDLLGVAVCTAYRRLEQQVSQKQNPDQAKPAASGLMAGPIFDCPATPPRDLLLGDCVDGTRTAKRTPSPAEFVLDTPASLKSNQVGDQTSLSQGSHDERDLDPLESAVELLPVESQKSTNGLRRKPGGALREVERVVDLRQLRAHRSLDSLASTMRAESNVSLASTGLVMRSRPPSFLPAAHLQRHSLRGQVTTSLLETYSIAPLLRASFEAQVAKLAKLPDDGEGGRDIALLKLEGRFCENPPSALVGTGAPRSVRTAARAPNAAMNDPNRRPALDSSTVEADANCHTNLTREPSQTSDSSIPLLSRSSMAASSLELLCSNPMPRPWLVAPPTDQSTEQFCDHVEVPEPDASATIENRKSESTIKPTSRADPSYPRPGSTITNQSIDSAVVISREWRSPSIDSGDFTSLREPSLAAHPLRYVSTPPLTMMQALRMTPPPTNSAEVLSDQLGTMKHHTGPKARNLLSGQQQPLKPLYAVKHHWHQDPAALDAHLCFVMAYDAEVLAQQFTLIEMDAMAEIDWKSLVDLEWTNRTIKTDNWADIIGDQHYTGIELAIARFNIVVRWAKSEIVLTRSIEERAATISKYIEVAESARKHQNFATTAQLAIALTSLDIIKLRKTWSLVSEQHLKTLHQLEQLISPFGDFKPIRSQMEACSLDQGFIPFLVVYTRDLVANADKRPARLPNQTDPDGRAGSLINFERYRFTAAVVKKLLRFQEASTRYEFPMVEDVCKRCLWMAAIEEEEIHWRAGLLE